MRFPTFRNQVAVLAALLLIPAGALAQGEEGPSPASLTVSPEEITLTAGETAQIEATALDEDGNEVEVEFLYLPLYGQYWNLDKRTWGFNIFKVSREGEVSTRRPGEFAVMVRVVGSGPDPSARNSEAEGYLQQRIPLTILPRPVASLNVTAEGPLYAGTEVTVRAEPLDDTGALVEGLEVTWASSDDAVAMPIARPPTIERTRTRGVLTLGAPGAVTVTATAGAASAEMAVEVVPNPVAKMELTPDRSTARTGDVTHLEVTMTDAAGATLEGVPVGFSVSAMTDAMGMGGPSSGLITQDGRFVAELPGVYTVVARTGSVSASTVIRIAERGVRRPIELVGHGRVKDRATSDLWVWEAPNGRDYAMTGTHSAAGHAYIWDVTDPEDLDIVDVVRVDARTVNDVKISEDGATAVISREGASNRRNGLVILDVSDPSTGVQKLAEYDDQLTGGVHNTFIHAGHVYALSGGRRFDIINIEDPSVPHRVGSFALDNPARSIHDVWVVEGIAYSANWSDGVAVIDVGGAGKGGTPQDPQLIGQFPFPTGWNHAVYPYRSVSTGKFYIFAGDEAARTGRYSPLAEIGTGTPGYDDEPTRWRGWVHILEWDENFEAPPRLVGRYEVPEAGSHNIWIEDDVMYVAFYNGGLRVVDVSGELLGNLYRQGREIARFLPLDPEGFLPNAPQVWGAQPHKGIIYFSDRNSGLWAVKLGELPEETTTDAQQ
ncbi:MAG: hypothetical protein F4023_00400 [Acidobacteria bacterium]|nr:hypothetical protein [Acidobacteriota bacterium]MYK78100.1 hypothetical protein [Acidobacteriota bacterium]